MPYTNIAGAYNQPTNHGGTDIYIARFTAQFQLFYSTFYGGGSNDYGIGVTVEQGTTNASYYTGSTYSSNFPTKPHPGIGSFFQSTLKGGADSYLIKMQGNLDRTYSTYFGGASDDFGYSIASGPNNATSQNILLCGQTYSNTLFPLYNPLNGAYFDGTNNGNDGFIGNFRNVGTLRTSQPENNADAGLNPNMYLVAEQSKGRVGFSSELSATIFPQPAQTQISINTNAAEFSEVEIFDAQGKQIDKFSTFVDNGNINYDVSHFPAGIYLLKLTCGYRNGISKFIITR